LIDAANKYLTNAKGENSTHTLVIIIIISSSSSKKNPPDTKNPNCKYIRPWTQVMHISSSHSHGWLYYTAPSHIQTHTIT
jgi:hypothetical protein